MRRLNAANFKLGEQPLKGFLPNLLPTFMLRKEIVPLEELYPLNRPLPHYLKLERSLAATIFNDELIAIYGF